MAGTASPKTIHSTRGNNKTGATSNGTTTTAHCNHTSAFGMCVILKSAWFRALALTCYGIELRIRSTPGVGSQKVKIGLFQIEGGLIHLRVGKKHGVDIPLPAVQLKDVGNDGDSWKNVVGQIVAAINRSAVRGVTKHQALQKAAEIAENARRGVKRATSGAIKSIKGLFKR